MNLLPAILDKQSQLNRSTRGQWNLYASHRQELEKLLVPTQPGGRICVLGAGNCNDLDLRWLTQVYREVQLIDIDAEALTRGATFQQVQASDKLKLRGNVDLTGLAERLGTWAKSPPAPAEIDACMRLASEPPTKLSQELGGPFDVVLSPCVLSQLITPLRDTIGEQHPGFSPLMEVMRARHFCLMLDLLAPGGRGVFACDLLSSASLPDLARVPADRVLDVMRKMLDAGKFFSGLDPASIRAVLTRHPALSPRTEDLRSASPWLWHLGLSKTYLVYAMTFRKKEESRKKPGARSQKVKIQEADVCTLTVDD